MPTIIAPVPADNPFPGAVTRILVEPDLTSRQILAWGIAGELSFAPQLLAEYFRDFPSEGVEVGDTIYIVDNGNGETATGVVAEIYAPDTLILTIDTPLFFSNAHYKIGAGDYHTNETLIQQIKATSNATAMLRWGTIWSNAPVRDFAPDYSGKLYTIKEWYVP